MSDRLMIHLLLRWLPLFWLVAGLACVPQPQAAPLATYLARTEPLLAQRSYGEAIIILEDAAQAHPGNALPLLRLGQIYLAQQRWLLAEDAFNRALVREAHQPTALAGLAESLLQQGRIGEALRFWQETTQVEPKLPSGFTGLGRTYLALLDFGAAKTAFLEQLRHQPDPEAHWYLAALTAPLDLSAAMTYLKASSPSNQPASLPEVETARQGLLARRDYLLKALSRFDSASPQAEVAQATGVALAQIQQWPLAFHALRLANEQKPGNATTLAFLGYTQAQTGRPALELFEQARQADPTSALPLYFHGIYLRQQGSLTAATELFNQAITLDPDNAAFYAELAETLAERGFLTAAEAGYKVAVEVSNNDPQFRLLLARFYAQRGYRLETAGIPLVKELLEQDESKAEVYELLGRMQFLAGVPDGGEAALRQAVELNPEAMGARYYLARLYETNGQTSSARLEYQKVIDWDTTGVFRERALKALQKLLERQPR